jgi:quercetin dioxygenase-like cupin family protein
MDRMTRGGPSTVTKRGRKSLRHRDLFGGCGEVRVWDLLGKRRIAPFMAVLACELDPGGSVGTHLQAEFPEIILFTEGHGRVRVDGVAKTVRPGTLIALPLGHSLAIENRSAERALGYLIIKAARRR